MLGVLFWNRRLGEGNHPTTRGWSGDTRSLLLLLLEKELMGLEAEFDLFEECADTSEDKNNTNAKPSCTQCRGSDREKEIDPVCHYQSSVRIIT
jgi:hypothetical protein